jgi:hypothetical protein
VILENDQGPVIWDNPQPAQVVDLVRILVPETRHHVPATRQTSWLTNLLPFPATSPHLATRSFLLMPPPFDSGIAEFESWDGVSPVFDYFQAFSVQFQPWGAESES